MALRINFGDLRIGEIAKERLKRAIAKHWVSEGDNVKEFEQKFAKQFGYKHAIATSSGTTACIAALASLYDFGAERGDEVIVPAATFVATANAVLAAGFTPKFVDIELETLNINPNKIEEAITDKTKAIMPVHLIGKPCEMDIILRIAKKYDLKVIEDACEAHGATYKNKIVGTIGDMGAFSFYCAHLIVCGEGGMVVTNDDKIANVVRSVKTHGRPTGSIYFDFHRFGLNLRMNDLTAAIGIEGIEHFDEIFNKRKDNLYKLLSLTKDLSKYCYFIKEEKHEKVCPHAFPLVLKDKKNDCAKLYKYLDSKGIQCKTLFGSLPTQHKAFEFLGYKYGDFPIAEYVGKNGLHFGIHQYLNDDDLIYIKNTLEGYFK
ncbi:MAG: DegT/DnrJ/EryC1/StrS family aminotransferase [Nanoarchaeota archaeon]|nr:DegT/DnrJ/EryC1/StrS family aminotransferase [Nanoarchaeota archaeon]